MTFEERFNRSPEDIKASSKERNTKAMQRHFGSVMDALEESIERYEALTEVEMDKLHTADLNTILAHGRAITGMKQDRETLKNKFAELFPGSKLR